MEEAEVKCGREVKGRKEDGSGRWNMKEGMVREGDGEVEGEGEG